MTTIAANRHSMAADRKVVDGATVYHSRKIQRVGTSLVGCAGQASACIKFLRWIVEADADDVPKFAKDEDVNALVLTADGRLFVYESECVADELEDDFYAIGTGSQAALAAMFCGMDPTGAVAVAARFNNDTGGPFDTLLLTG